jgi:hypothetical protein
MINRYADVRPVYTIDALNRMVFVNAAWSAFFAPQGGVGPQLRDVIGLPVWEFIPVGPARQLWEVLYNRVRAMGAGVFVPMRMDRVDQRRLVDIELRPVGDGSIRHICEPVWMEARPAVALLDASYPRDERVLRHCSWCHRIQVRLGAWEEVEEAQRALAIMAEATLPQLQPAVCSTCKQSLLKTFPARVA